MKKFITLALAFALVLGLTVPALAFTTKEPDEEVSVPYEISIKLVEVSEDDFGMLFSLPPSDRGYAKNEIVTAVATLLSPKGSELVTDGYTMVIFGAENVKLETNVGALNSWEVFRSTSLPGGIYPTDYVNGTDNEIAFLFTDSRTPAAEQTAWNTKAKFTMAVAFSGKVTDDDALMYVKLTKNKAFAGTPPTLTIGDFDVVKTVGSNTNIYTVIKKGGNVNTLADRYFEIHSGKNDKSTRMVVYENSIPYEVYVDQNGNIAFAAAVGQGVQDENNALTYHNSIEVDHPSRNVRNMYKKVKAVYDDYVVDEFGFDFFLRGNVVNDKTFTGIANADDLYEEVAIEPWYAYVEVPPAIQVDPPKTGDAMSIVGFIMIALAGLAVVAVKKVRA